MCLFLPYLTLALSHADSCQNFLRAKSLGGRKLSIDFSSVLAFPAVLLCRHAALIGPLMHARYRRLMSQCSTEFSETCRKQKHIIASIRPIHVTKQARSSSYEQFPSTNNINSIHETNLLKS